MITRFQFLPGAAPSLIPKTVGSCLTVAVVFIGSLTVWACGGKDTVGPGAGNGTVADPVAVQLAFTVQPIETQLRERIAPAVEVAIQDALGRTVAGATDVVTLRIGDNPGGGTLSGPTAVGAVDGIATFGDLSIDKIASGYTLVATSGTLTTASSSPFGIVFTLATVGVGRKHSCGLTTSGTAYCWGDNTEGQLGDASNISSTRPVPVAGGRHFVQLTSGGRNHTCGLTANGEAYCWGENPFGQLGDGGTTNSNVPVRAAPGITFANVDAGTYHTCGVATDGTAYCWGSNGPLFQGGDQDGWAFGTPTTTMCDNNLANYRGDQWHCSLTPVAVPGPALASITAGLWASCGVTASGDAYCTGWNTVWALGNGTIDHATAMTPVSGSLSFDAVNLGAFGGCGLVGVSAHCWGGRLFNNGATGNGTMDGSSTPEPVAGGLSFASVHPSGANNIYPQTCGLTTSGEAYCWGNNRFGGLGTEAALESCVFGDGSWMCSSMPVLVAGGFDFISLATGQAFACGVDRSGAGYCWGQNDTGQLGDGTITDSTVPVRILDPR